MENKNEYNEINKTFVIDAGDDSSANFDLVISNLVDEANESKSVINLKVQLIRTENIHARKNNLVDEIKIRIVPTSKAQNEADLLTQYVYARMLALDNSFRSNKYPNSVTTDNLKFIESLKLFDDAKNSVVKGKENSNWEKVSKQILDYHENTFISPYFKENSNKETKKEIINNL